LNKMNLTTGITLSTSPPTHSARKPRLTARSLYKKSRRRYTGKEQDSETGLYYYGARYLDSKTGRWLSGDPAVSDYIPSAPVNEEARKRNGSLPGMGGVFNYANLHVYHYAGNNPVKYTDPDGEAINFVAGAIIGATTGAALNVAGQYINAKITGQEFKLDVAQFGAAALGGAVAGAITSGTSAVASLVYQPVAAQAVMTVGGAVAGAAGGAVSTITENAMKGNDLSLNLKENVVIGTITGGISSATAPAPKTSHQIDKLNIVRESTASAVKRETLKEGINLIKDLGIDQVVDFVKDKLINSD